MLINDSIDQESIGDIVEKSQVDLLTFLQQIRVSWVASRRLTRPQHKNRCFHVNDGIAQQIIFRILSLVLNENSTNSENSENLEI